MNLWQLLWSLISFPIFEKFEISRGQLWIKDNLDEHDVGNGDIEEVIDREEGNDEEQIKTPDEEINHEVEEEEDCMSIFVPTDLNEVAIAGEIGHLDGVSKMLGTVIAKIYF